MKDMSLLAFSDYAHNGLIAMVTKMDSDWVRWSVEKLAIPALASAFAVYITLSTATAEADKQIAVVSTKMQAQQELLIDLKRQVLENQGRILELMRVQYQLDSRTPRK